MSLIRTKGALMHSYQCLKTMKEEKQVGPTCSSVGIAVIYSVVELVELFKRCVNLRPFMSASLLVHLNSPQFSNGRIEGC